MGGGETLLWLALGASLFLGLLFVGRAGWAVAALAAVALSGWAAASPESWLLWSLAAGLALGVGAVLAVPSLRREWVTRQLVPFVARRLPRLGETERTALEAGTVGWDAQLFSGAPDWKALFALQERRLSEKERAFLDGPVQELCARLDDWEIVRNGDLPDSVWEFLREHRFFGLIVPEEHGGLGFSARAHGAVVAKLASRSVTAAVTVMVPNSLGPAELLLHYGTDEQKRHYLPRLARGEEIPCFALTGPEAGSDAAAMQSEGVVCRDKWRGEDVLGIRLRWSKRYITLAPVATLIGLAFRMRDPDGLLGDREDLGITCALVPANLPGIEIGDRHDPMGIPFQNGPITGEDVFVPIEAVIGGREGVGEGWRMLMESLSAGRSISLPSLAVASSKLCARVTSAYAMVREQFDTPIGRFEGVEEPLARIAGLTYATAAARTLTLDAVDAGERPAVLSAIVKAYCTEAMRDVVNHAMDIRAGAGIMRGPRNILGRVYPAIPIGITVEGANILTRSMIIYGQGAIRCHPFAFEEILAVEQDDLPRLDRALFGHVGSLATNACRALLLGISRGRLERDFPAGSLRPYGQRLARLSAGFALVSDAAMLSLGGALKRKEAITGRLADALAWLYLGSATLERFRRQGEPDADLPLATWALEHALAEVERALAGVLRNLPARPLAWLLAPLVFPLGRAERGPDDDAGARAAQALLGDGGVRERLTAGIYRPDASEPGLGVLEAALQDAREALSVEAKLRVAVRDGRLERRPGTELETAAFEAGVISEQELQSLRAADAARDEAIRVDAFPAERLAR